MNVDDLTLDKELKLLSRNNVAIRTFTRGINREVNTDAVAFM